MEKTYEHRESVKSLSTLYFVIGGLLAPLMFLSLFIEARVAIIFLPILLISGLLLFSVKRVVSLKITLRDSDVIYNLFPKTKIVLRYEDISRIESRSIPFVGGWLKIVPLRGRPLPLPIGLKDCKSLVLTLKERMDEFGLQKKYDERELFCFYRTIVYGEASRDRMKHGWIFLVIGGMVLNLSMIYGIYWNEIISVILLAFASLGIGLAPWIYIDSHGLLKRIKAQAMKPDWDLDSGDPAESMRRTTFAALWFLFVQIVFALIQVFFL